ncbi:hypothetical protein OH786_01235 [Streptomyces atratus]|uniref:Glycosyltransferase, MGT family n=1 Tax=Streptomyces atratus TaxID=1893 RepID=A0A1K1YFD2_STRAR|nr:nucleotide disphospho-sugar-binding domain-containing protein [Streptomyces atratus]SFX60631.1 glycosyltransferase, MGT family [Streptomyces atratus]
MRDEVDFGTVIAAESLALPCATVLVLAAGGFLRKEVVAEPLHELRSAYGLPPDPRLAVLDRHPVLSPFPPNFRDPRFPLPAHTFSFRPTAAGPADTAPRTPTVYFTLGTVDNTTDLFSRVLTGLRELPVNVVVTVGERVDPANLGPLPDHVRVEQFVPQELLLPQCDLVVSHGGSGSLMGALAHGLPSVLIFLGSDQPYNARRCVELGTAQVLDPVTVTPEEVRTTVSAVLADGGYRRSAERVRKEINALPVPEQTIPPARSVPLINGQRQKSDSQSNPRPGETVRHRSRSWDHVRHDDEPKGPCRVDGQDSSAPTSPATGRQMRSPSSSTACSRAPRSARELRPVVGRFDAAWDRATAHLRVRGALWSSR